MDFNVFVKQETVNVLIALNTGEATYRSASYDKQFLKTLMEDIFGNEELSMGCELDSRKVAFVKGI